MPAGKLLAAPPSKATISSTTASVAGARSRIHRVIVVASAALQFWIVDSTNPTSSGARVYVSPAAVAAGDVFELETPMDLALSFRLLSGTGTVILEYSP